MTKTTASSSAAAWLAAPLEARMSADHGAGRAGVIERLAHEIARANSDWRTSGASAAVAPDTRRERVLLVECLRMARQVVERGDGLVNAQSNVKENTS
jgi:hypothetical protein